MNLKQNKPLLFGGGAVLLVALAWLAFGFFGIHTAFIDNEVNEAGPVFARTVEEQEEVAATDEFNEAVDEAEQNRTTADDSVEDMEDDMPGEIVTIYSGDFTGSSRYNVNGVANVLNDGSEQRFLRFEEFESSNGPDLKVYLRADNGDFVSLGDLKGNIGSQNYEIPTDVDLDTFSNVEIWCERFGVGFGSAPLAAS